MGALQYLAIIRPDISTVNHASQFLQNPTDDHFLAVKSILCYIKGTSPFGLTYSRSKPCLLAYLDVDWASCPTHEDQPRAIPIFLVLVLFCGVPRNNLRSHFQVVSPSITLLLMLLQTLFGPHISW